MSHSTVNYAQIERRKVESLNYKCSSVENNISVLAYELNFMVNCIENRSGMSSNQLNSYLNSISTELIKLTNEKIRRQLVISCQNAASQISSIESFLEEKYTTSKNIENYSIAELQNLLSKYNSQINDLEFKKAEKIKKNVEEKIMELSAKFDVTTTEHISSKTVENKREQVHRNQFELDRYKDLIITKLTEIEDIDFATNYEEKLKSVNNQIEYKIWVNKVNNKILQESLLSKYSKAQTEILEKIPYIPDGPSKNTLEIEIKKLTKPEYWGDNSEKWEENLKNRADKINNFLDEELEAFDEERYINECLIEAFAEQGIMIDTTDSNTKYAMLGKSEDIESHALGINIDYDKKTFSFDQILLDTDGQGYKNLSGTERKLCPKIYAAMDKINEFGINNNFTIESPPVPENIIVPIENQMSKEDLDRQRIIKQEQYQYKQQQKLQQIQREIN